tara:strand:- start:386 stop:976 length:591 start_codon:yes stop_codon:yes gene_type:complete
MKSLPNKFIFPLYRYILPPSNPLSKIGFSLNKPGSISIGQDEICVAKGACKLHTYGLINCLAVGGIFPYENFSFLTHRSPKHVQYLTADTKKCISKITPHNNLLQGDFCIFRLSDSKVEDLSYEIGNTSYSYDGLIHDFLVNHLQDCYPNCNVHILPYEPFYTRIGLMDKRLSGGLAIVNPKRGVFETSLELVSIH